LKITGIELLPYSLPMGQVIGTHRFRSGWLVRVEGSTVVGYGDVACWPGFGSSPDRVKAAARELLAAGSLVGAEVLGLHDVRRLTQTLGDSTPELSHGVELALLDLLARTQGKSIAELLCDAPRARIAVHHLVTDTEHAQDAAAQGARCLKLKIGFEPAAGAVRRVAALREQLPMIALRLDVNGSWDLATASRTLRALEPFAVDWVEQPLATGALADLARLRQETSIPLVVDEDVSGRDDLERVLDAEAADGVVIKPMFCGGPLTARDLVRQATQGGLSVCVTHALESAIGRTGAIHLVAATPEIAIPCGLTQCLREDLAPSPLQSGDWVEVPGGPGLGIEPFASLRTPEEVL
jgi:L-Ala-D/L-Glu epimerase